MSIPALTPDPEVLEAVNGVIIPGFFGTELPGWLAAALDEGLAGVVYFGQNISEDTAALSASVRAHRPNALIAIDEEGGTVTRLEAAHGSTIPGPAQLGRVNDVGLSTAAGAAIAARARAAGVNLVLGPVADVNTNPANPVIGVRSFGTEAPAVAVHTAAAVRGIQARGDIAACAKHFPGHGDTRSDSHLDLPELEMGTAEIEDVHFEPFRAAVDAGVRAVMTAHIRVPEWGQAPATLNPLILGKLRALGFGGVIITDALDMAAIRESVGAGPGAVAAIRAGADLLCIGNPRTNPGTTGEPDADYSDYQEARDALLASVASGELHLDLLQRAAARVRSLADGLEAARILSVPQTSDSVPGSGRNTEPEPDWAAEVASALEVQGSPARHGSRISLLDLRTRATIAVASESDAFRQAFAVRRELDPVLSEAAVPDGLGQLGADTGVVVLVDRIGVPGSQREALEQIEAIRPDAVVVNVGVVPGAGYGCGLDRIDALAGSALSAGIVAGLICAEGPA